MQTNIERNYSKKLQFNPMFHDYFRAFTNIKHLFKSNIFASKLF